MEEIIKKQNSFTDICHYLNKIESRSELGSYFEYFAKLVLLHDPRWTNFVKECWLLKELPVQIREYLEIPENDIGIDLVVKTKDDEYFAVQVKYRRNLESVIDWKNLSTFFGLTFGLTKKFSKGIFFTNTKNPNKYISGHENIILILYHSLIDISENTITKIKNSLGCKLKEKIIYKPREYQVDIISKQVEYFSKYDRGRLYMPCGTGKTLVCYWIANQLPENRKICIAVPSLYLLSQMYSDWVEQRKTNYLLVGQDAEIKTCNDTGLLLTTQRKEIKKYLLKHDEAVIITTYQSSDILAKVCRKIDYKLDLIIFDEAHKTVGTIDKQFAYLLDDNNISTGKKLFTTATEKVYTGDNDDILSMDDVNIYGKVIYNYSFKSAIEQGQLCDYKIVAPLINDEGFLKVVQKNKFVIDKNIDIDEIEQRYYMSAYLLCRNIVERGLTHILTFNNTNDSAKKIYQILSKLTEQMNINCQCYYLTGETGMKKRRKVVDEFITQKCSIISSARIFQEGVNIPIVDCVCFMDNKLQTIDIVQSVGRVLRLCNGKKLGYILIPSPMKIIKDEDNLFDIDPSDFGKIKSILRAIGTIDNRVIDEFIVKDGHMTGSQRKFELEKNDVEISANLEIDFNDLVDNIRPTGISNGRLNP